MNKPLFTSFSNLLITGFLAACILIIPMGCNSGATSSSYLSTIPSVSNFSLASTTPFVKGQRTTVDVSSSTLGNGLFTVLFTLSGGNTGTNSAELTMSGGVGTFLTTVLPNDAPTTLTVNYLIYTYDTFAVTTNNSTALYDSSGSMTATYTPHGGSAVPLTATDVTATLTSGVLNIQGVVWGNNLTTTISLFNNSYTGTPGTISFNAGGNATFAETGSATINDASASGSFTITAVSPLLTGTFSFTNADASVVTGTFSCPAP